MVGNRGGPTPATEGVVNTNTRSHTNADRQAHRHTLTEERERGNRRETDRKREPIQEDHDSASKFRF